MLCQGWTDLYRAIKGLPERLPVDHEGGILGGCEIPKLLAFASLLSGKSVAASRGRKGCRQIAPPLLTKLG